MTRLHTISQRGCFFVPMFVAMASQVTHCPHHAGDMKVMSTAIISLQGLALSIRMMAFFVGDNIRYG
jgi:hypothetical protein